MTLPTFPWPVDHEHRLTSDFGVKRSPELVKKLGLIHAEHQGHDFGTPIGSPCYAVCRGKVGLVRTAEDGNGFGNRLALFTDVNGVMLQIFYTHLSAFNVKEGDHVRAGQMLALTGHSGKVSGPHLHLEVWRLPERKAIGVKFSKSVQFA